MVVIDNKGDRVPDNMLQIFQGDKPVNCFHYEAATGKLHVSYRLISISFKILKFII